MSLTYWILTILLVCLFIMFAIFLMETWEYKNKEKPLKSIPLILFFKEIKKVILNAIKKHKHVKKTIK